MKKVLAIFLAMLMLLTLFTGCAKKQTESKPEAETPAQTDAAQTDAAQTETAEPQTKALSDMTFADVASSTNDYWTRLQDGVRDAAAEAGITVMESITQEGDIPAGVAAVDAAIASGVDGIITMCGDPAAYIETINRAVESGIIVVTVDQDSPESKRQYFVGTSNYGAGKQMGEYFLSQVGDTEQKIAFYAGTITANNAVERMEGFEDAISGSSNIEIVTREEVKNDVQITMDKTYALFNGYPDVTAIYGVFAYDPLGAAKACKELGRDDVFVLGFDDLEDSVQLLKEGWIKALAVQQPYEIGKTAVETMVAAVQGNGPELGEIGTDVKILTAENIDG